MILNVALNLIA